MRHIQKALTFIKFLHQEVCLDYRSALMFLIATNLYFEKKGEEGW